MRAALTNRSPIHVEVAKDLWTKPVSQAINAAEPFLNTTPISSPQVIKQAVELFTAAERPVIYIGRGARNAIHEVMKLAEKAQAPVVRTLGAAGFTPGFHSQVVGGIGAGGSEAATTLIEESDCMLRIGATWWPEKSAPSFARVVSINMEPAHVAIGIEPMFGVVGDAGAVLKRFIPSMSTGNRQTWSRRVAEVKQVWDACIEQETQVEAAAGVTPARLMRTIEAVAPANAIITLDVGEHTLWFNRVFRGKGQDLVFSGKWRTMGFGLPAAAAAKTAYPARPVLAIVGDGGLGMMLGEFVSLVNHSLPVVIIVVNNASLALEKHRMECMGMSPAGTLLKNPDFAGIAKLCGGAGYRVKHHGDLAAVLSECMALDVPAIIDITMADTMIPTVPAQI
jgi:pyruvate dehydrogenase (quinone)/pyruvate oxidase